MFLVTSILATPQARAGWIVGTWLKQVLEHVQTAPLSHQEAPRHAVRPAAPLQSPGNPARAGRRVPEARF
jgi:hypothetical protein